MSVHFGTKEREPFAKEIEGINVVDYRSRIDRTVYVLECNGNGYVVINNDPRMDPDGKITEETKLLSESTEEKRDIVVARIRPDWKGQLYRKLDTSGIEIEGFGYSSCISGLHVGLGVVRGKIEPNDKNSYTTTNLTHIKEDEDYQAIVQLIDDKILDNLEHFTVPKSIAVKMRKMAKADK